MGTVLYLATEDVDVQDPANLTLSFQASGLRLDRFIPNLPESLEADSVKETFEVYVDLPEAQRAAKIWEINNFFLTARSWLPGRRRLYLVYAVDSGQTLYRARVIDGKAGAGPMLRKRWTDGNIRIQVEILREAFWERDSEEELALRSENSNTDPGSTGGIHIFNHYDEIGTSPNKHVNGFFVCDSEVDGDLPAPVRVMVTALQSQIYNRAFVGVDVSMVNRGYASGPDLSGTADATCSGGSYQALTWSGTTETDIYAAAMEDPEHFIETNYYKLVMRLQAALSYTDLKLRVKIQYEYKTSGYIDVYVGEQVLLSNGFQVYDLDTVMLPPIGQALPLGGAVLGSRLVITAQRATAGSHALNVDFLQWFGTDGWTNFYPLTDLTDLGGGTLRLDFTTYPFKVEGVGTSDQPFYGNDGPGLWITPARDNLFHVLMIRANKSHVVDDDFMVRVYYRARKVVL